MALKLISCIAVLALTACGGGNIDPNSPAGVALINGVMQGYNKPAPAFAVPTFQAPPPFIPIQPIQPTYLVH